MFVEEKRLFSAGNADLREGKKKREKEKKKERGKALAEFVVTN